jgi:hypothetical protein
MNKDKNIYQGTEKELYALKQAEKCGLGVSAYIRQN